MATPRRGKFALLIMPHLVTKPARRDNTKAIKILKALKIYYRFYDE